jgi:hypothetical protein
LLLRRIEALEEAVDTLLSRQLHGEQREQVSAAVLSALLVAQDRYIPSTADGWLLALASGTRTALPSGLKVSLTNSSGGRDYCTVLEGPLAGTTFDLAAGNISDSYKRFSDLTITVNNLRLAGGVVIGGVRYEREVRIRFNDGTSQRTIGPFVATDITNPIPIGEHDVEIPEYPHPGGVTYGGHATVWFRIDHHGDRYVHAGKVGMAGCLTCAPSQWEQIYAVLHCARVDKVNVGKLIVR